MKEKSGGRRAACPVARAIDAVGDGWSLLIVRDAFDGISRFGDFQSSLGIARNILTVRLRSLEAAGVLTTVPSAEGSAYRDYVLTPAGRDLFPIVLSLRQWGEAHLFAPGEKRSELIERSSGKSVPRQTVKGSNGRALKPEDTEVRKVPRA